MADPKLKLGNDIWATKQKSLLAYNDEGGNFKSLPFQVERISGGTYLGRNGLVQSAASNEPRIDFLNNTKGGLLLEPQRTNLCLYSETLSDWQVLSGASLQTINDNDAIAPDGTQSASTITFSSNGSSLLRHYSSTSYTSAKHSCSFWAKKISGNGTIQFGLTDTETEFTPTDEWVKYEVNNITPTNFGLPLFLDLNFVCSAGDKIAVWGMQFEAGTYSTSTIPTSGSAVTRVQDEVFNGGNQYIFNDSEGTLFLDNYDFKSSVNPEITLSNGAASNRITLVYYPSSNQLRFFISSNNVVQADQFVSYTYSQRNKIALRYKQNDFKAYINGTQVFSDTSGNTPVGLSRFDFSKYNQTNGFFEGEIYQTKIYNEALSDSELATLTTI